MYDVFPPNAPRTTGWRLSALAGLLETPLAGPVLAEYLYSLVGMERFRAFTPPDALPALHPLLAGYPPAAPTAEAMPSVTARKPAQDFPFRTIADFAAAYREGLSPVAVADQVLARR